MNQRLLWQINRSPGRHFRSPWLAARDLFMRWNLLWLSTCQSLMSRLQSVARFNSVCVEKDHFSFDPFGSFGNLWYLIVISLHYQCNCQHFSLVQDCKDRPRGRESHRPYEGAGRCREVFVVMSCHLVISRHIVSRDWSLDLSHLHRLHQPDPNDPVRLTFLSWSGLFCHPCTRLRMDNLNKRQPFGSLRNRKCWEAHGQAMSSHVKP